MRRPIRSCSTSSLPAVRARAFAKGWRRATPGSGGLRQRCWKRSAPSMAYRVEVTPRAARDLRAIYHRIAAVHAAQAQAWFNGLTELILSLDQHPLRGAFINEGPGLRH